MLCHKMALDFHFDLPHATGTCGEEQALQHLTMDGVCNDVAVF